MLQLVRDKKGKELENMDQELEITEDKDLLTFAKEDEAIADTWQ